MATYLEIHNLHSNSDMLAKTAVAIGDAAIGVYEEAPGTDNHANRLIWAKEALEAPGAMARKMYSSVLVANKGASVAAILSASDAVLLGNIIGVIDLYATGA